MTVELLSHLALFQKNLCDESRPPGHCLLGDSAFATSAQVTNGKIMRARKIKKNCPAAASAELVAIDMVLEKVYPSERQSAEWVVRAIATIRSTLPNPHLSLFYCAVVVAMAHTPHLADCRSL